MPTEADVLDSLRQVEDPELRRPLVDLELVKSVRVIGAAVHVTVGLPGPDYPSRTELRNLVSAAVGAVPGIDSVSVDLVSLSEAEQSALSARLRPTGDGGQRDNPFNHSGTRVIAVASGKGGVGKSSVTTNLAVALARAGYDTAAVDADVWGFSMPRMLGIDRPPLVINPRAQTGPIVWLSSTEIGVG
ncbi:MAG: P-loop NTPase, partial [Acidimicrobiia bacterium]